MNQELGDYTIEVGGDEYLTQLSLIPPTGWNTGIELITSDNSVAELYTRENDSFTEIYGKTYSAGVVDVELISWRERPDGSQHTETHYAGTITSFADISYVTQFGNVEDKTITSLVTDEFLPQLTEEGWIFDGWFNSNSYDLRYSVGDRITVSALTFYAKWKRPTPERNKIEYLDYEFGEDTIVEASIHLENAMVAETLGADTLTFTLNAPSKGGRLIDSILRYLFDSEERRLYAKGGISDLTEYTYGEPVYYYHNEELYGKFYVTDIYRSGKSNYTFECISAVGLLIYTIHNGGVYGASVATSATDLISEIVGDIEIDIDPIFETILVQGWLPRASSRDNLQQVLFALGASILKDDGGNLVVKYNEPDAAQTIPDERIYIGGSENHIAHATIVSLIEHGYYIGSETDAEELFNNLDSIESVINYTLAFSSPYYDIKAYDIDGNDITDEFIVSSGDNYAVIGTPTCSEGRVVGKPYIHTQRRIQKRIIENPIVENEVEVTNMTLVSALNSSNCLERLAEYYGYANETQMDIVVEGEKTGSMVQYSKVYDEQETQLGYIKTMDINVSTILKSNTTLSTDWQPNHLGNSYNRYLIIDKEMLGGLEGTFTVPEELDGKEVYIVMFSGADGGQGGFDGENGERGTVGDLYIAGSHSGEALWDLGSAGGWNGDFGYGGQGGKGGNGGQGGSGSKRYGSAVLTFTEGEEYDVALGEGGDGGARGEFGLNGEQTTFDVFTSDRQDLNGVYVNIVDQSVYCKKGITGANGAAGGNGGRASNSREGYPVIYEQGTDGADFVYGDIVNLGGNKSNGSTVYEEMYWDLDEPPRTRKYNVNVGGGGGGGAAYGVDAEDAEDAPTTLYWDDFLNGSLVMIYGTNRGGDGGNGATPIALPQTTEYGGGGNGGFGGGGGGGSGASATYNGRYAIRPSQGGQGGQGGQAAKGADGFIIVYYQE